MRSGGQSGDGGFTLLEALLATLLMSIILGSLATITSQWLPNWDRGFARLQGDALTNLALERLTDDLSAAEFISTDTRDKVPLFDGAEHAVTFVRNTLAPNAASGLELVRVAAVSDESGPMLIRSTAPLPTGFGQSQETMFSSPVVLIHGPYRITFSYAGPDRVWRDTWQGQATLPRAIKIALRDNATSTLLATSTSTPVYVELPARCAWSNANSDCPELSGQGGPLAISGNGGSSPNPADSSAGAMANPAPSNVVMPVPTAVGGQ